MSKFNFFISKTKEFYQKVDLIDGNIYMIFTILFYYIFLERFWLFPKSVMAFGFTLSLNILIYNLSFTFLKNKIGKVIRGIYLSIFSLLLISASIGKVNWQEIPRIKMLYKVVFQNFSTISNYVTFPTAVSILSLVIVIILLSYKFASNELFKLERKKIILVSVFISIFCCSFINWRNNVSSNRSSRELFAEDPIIGAFIDKKNYGINISNSYIRDQDGLASWKLKDNSPDVVIINFDALRPDLFWQCIDERRITPTFDSLLSLNTTYYSFFHTSSASSSFNGILSTLYGNNVEHLPINKIGIQQILRNYGYESNFILSGSHDHFMNLKEQYGDNDNYFESTNIRRINDTIREDDDVALLNYLEYSHRSNSFKKQFYYFHVMAPHLGAYRDDAPLRNPINNSEKFNEIEKKYFIGLNKADVILKELIQYFYKKRNRRVVLYITADHGDGIGRHKYIPIVGHNQPLTYETINTPLIIVDNENIKSIRRKYTTQIDLLPTIVERCFTKYEIPEHIFSGKSMYGDSLINRYTYHSSYVTKYQDFNFAIIKDSLGTPTEKYLYIPKDRKEFIFNLRIDKNENDTINQLSKFIFYRKLKSNFLKY